MIAVGDKPIHERELADLQAEYAARLNVNDRADHGYIYQTDGAHWQEFDYTLPRWHYEHAISEYRRIIDKTPADEIRKAFDDVLVEDGGREPVDDPDNAIPEYIDKRREGRFDLY